MFEVKAVTVNQIHVLCNQCIISCSVSRVSENK